MGEECRARHVFAHSCGAPLLRSDRLQGTMSSTRSVCGPCAHLNKGVAPSLPAHANTPNPPPSPAPAPFQPQTPKNPNKHLANHPQHTIHYPYGAANRPTSHPTDPPRPHKNPVRLVTRPARRGPLPGRPPHRGPLRAPRPHRPPAPRLPHPPLGHRAARGPPLHRRDPGRPHPHRRPARSRADPHRPRRRRDQHPRNPPQSRPRPQDPRT